MESTTSEYERLIARTRPHTHAHTRIMSHNTFKTVGQLVPNVAKVLHSLFIITMHYLHFRLQLFISSCDCDKARCKMLFLAVISTFVHTIIICKI